MPDQLWPKFYKNFASLALENVPGPMQPSMCNKRPKTPAFHFILFQLWPTPGGRRSSFPQQEYWQRQYRRCLLYEIGIKHNEKNYCYHRGDQGHINITVHIFKNRETTLYKKYLYESLTLKQVLNFVSLLLNQGVSYSALNLARSTLSTFIIIDSKSVVSHSVVIRLPKGLSNKIHLHLKTL